MLLLITERPDVCRALTEHLHRHGVYLLCGVPETALFLADSRDTGGVILDCVPNEARGEELCRALRTRYAEMPIAVIVSPNSVPSLPADAILRENDMNALCSHAYEFCVTCGWHERPYQTYELTVGLTPDQTVYMGYPLPLSPRAHSILRCLFYRAPLETSADDLMSLCYTGEHKSISNLTVQIHEINKRALKIDPRLLIVSVYGKGYRLRDGIL